MTSPVAAAMATLRPREMLAPGSTSTRSGRRPAYSWMTATVLSREPPSTITTSSGRRVWASRLSSRRRMASPSLSTVLMTVTRTRPPLTAATGEGIIAEEFPISTIIIPAETRMRIRSSKGLTFDDVLLIPQRSPIASRKDVDTSSFVTPAIKVRVPVLSANMDTVTEAAMAIAMARAGGLGIIHRFMTVEQQVRQIKQVKRSQGFVVDNPYTIGPDESISDATRAMQLHEVGGLVVTGEDGRLVGLVTHRDILLAPPIVAGARGDDAGRQGDQRRAGRVA